MKYYLRLKGGSWVSVVSYTASDIKLSRSNYANEAAVLDYDHAVRLARKWPDLIEIYDEHFNMIRIKL